MELFGHKEQPEKNLYKESLKLVELDINRSAPAVMEISNLLVPLLGAGQTREVNEVAEKIDKQLNIICKSLGLNISVGEDGVSRIKNRSGDVVAEFDKTKKSEE